MPKKAKQPVPQEELSQSVQEEEIADVPADEVPDDTDVPDLEYVATVPAVPGTSRKRIRPSKKDVQDYPFTDDQMREIANFVQSHPELYDKSNEKWLNPSWKLSLWMELAEQFSDCSHLQVKKLVEKKRTDFGKIEKRENKSGSAGRPRTQREQKVVEVWGFLAGHIAHETTQPSEDFGRPRDDPESSSHESALSAHSLARRKRKRKKERQGEDLSSPRSSKDSPERSAIQELLQSAQLLATRKPPLEGRAADIQKFVDFMQTRLMKVSPMHLGVLFCKINNMITVMEEPVMGRSAIKDPRRLLDPLSIPVGVPGPSQQWQPPGPPTVAPPPPPPVYHQPQYQQPHYAQPHYLQQQYQQPQQQYQQPQQSEQQQFSQQPVGTPMPWDQILGCTSSPINTKLQALMKTKSPTKKAIMSPMLETPRAYEPDDSDE